MTVMPTDVRECAEGVPVVEHTEPAEEIRPIVGAGSLLADEAADQQ